MLDSGERTSTRAAMPSRPGKEPPGLFPHPALSSRQGSVPRRSPSFDDLPPATVRTPPDDTNRRIEDAYRKYVALCAKHAQAFVGKEAFVQRLRERLEKLQERCPREKIEFRPVVDDGVVRVRVVLAKQRA